MVDVLSFWDALAADSSRQGADYFADHAARFEATYNAVTPFVTSKTRILTVGGGSCYVEAALKRAKGADVAVLDFPEAIAAHQPMYERLGLVGVATDLSASKLDLPPAAFDIVLSSEVMEHIPEAPSQQLGKLIPAIAPGGRVFVTTPNLASLGSIAKLILGRPLLPEPKKTFAPIGFENEGVHRREYMPVEIETAMKSVGLVPQSRTYCWYHRRQPAHPAQVVESAIRRLRPCMIIHGLSHNKSYPN